jgi:hypothetical protein
MVTRIACCVVALALAGVAEATVVNTNDPTAVANFQSGATVNDFENVPTRTPQAISAYTPPEVVSAGAGVFNEIPGVQFSVGGVPGTNRPALYSLTDGIAGDAKSPTTVLGPVSFDDPPTTLFGPGAQIEIFFPTKVAKVGFWLNPALGNVTIIALDTNFAFSGQPESNLETGTNVTAGNFVGIERPTADIGGFKILGLGQNGFTIDDFTFGGSSSTTVPEPGTLALLGSAVAAFSVASRRRRRR